MLKTVSTISGFVSPTFTGDVTLSNGNLVLSTSGKGIDFSATSGTGTSELLADYEEGTWTPVGDGVTYASASGTYTKVGRQVTVVAKVVFPSTVDTSRPQLKGLPFTTGSLDYTPEIFQGTATPITGLAYAGTTLIELYNYADTPVLRNSALSGLTVRLQMTYFV